MHFKSHLSCERRRLVELMQEINFGHVKELRIRQSQPVFEPMPTIVREYKFAADNGPRGERKREDFLLKQQVLELFGQLDEIGNGVIDELEIKHGLPFRMVVTELAI